MDQGSGQMPRFGRARGPALVNLVLEIRGVGLEKVVGKGKGGPVRG